MTTYYGIYYAPQGQKPELCEVLDDGVCYEAFQNQAVAYIQARKYGDPYEVLPVPRGTRVWDHVLGAVRVAD